jgi:arylsulfatase A-like enzyme
MFKARLWVCGWKLASISCCLLAAACGPGKVSPPSPALRDPMVVAVDGLAPANGFAGLGSLFPGEGWGRPEGSGDEGDWGTMAWVVGREAVVHLLLPPGPKKDFFARCLPYPWAEGSPQQEMELLVGDRVIGHVALIRDWQDVRIPLPENLPRNQLLDLRLRFAHALKPLDRGEADPRSLAAAFTQIAVVPREVEDTASFLKAHALDPATGKARLPVGGGLRLPLPPASRLRLELGIDSSCQGCELSLELMGTSGAPRLLTTETAKKGRTIEVDFDTEPRGIQSLWIRVSAARPAQPPGAVELVLGSMSVQARDDPGPTPPPHVFLYLIDTLRADALGPYGGDPELSPSMNAFAGEALTYLRAYAPSSWTLPSVVSLLTGQYPDRHGVMEGQFRYDAQRLPGLQQLLGERGYRTVEISHSFIVSKAYGLDAGFGSYYLNDHLNGLLLRSEEARGLLATWLSQNADGSPVFAYLHTVDPHAPYSPPQKPLEVGMPSVLAAQETIDRVEAAHMRQLYDKEVRYADREFGRFVELLKWLGLYDHSFVILAADHGEEFAEHGGFEHGTTLFEEVLRVPLIVKYPGGRWAGARVGEPVSLVDVAPTVLAAESREGTFDGSVLPGPEGAKRRAVYFEVAPAHDESSGRPRIDLRGMVLGNVKCIEDRAEAPRLQVFDLAADPAEQRPLPPDAVDTARCRRLLDGWSVERKRQVKSQRSRIEATPETLERLRALGYLN